MPYSFNPLSGLGLDQSIPLDGAGKIPSGYLPSYVDDVEEYADLASFPATGETGKIYVAIDTGFTYRWSGSAYVRINSLDSITGDVDVAADGTSSIASGVIVNDDVNASAAIAGTKIDPDFGSQTVETTGDLAINTDVLFVDSSESAVGIGTTSPDAKFEVVENSTGSVELARLRIEGQTNNPMLRIFADEANKTVTLDTSGSVSGTELVFKEGGSEAARIDSSGRLLVGTSSQLDTFFGTSADKLCIGGGAAPQIIGCYSVNQFGPRLDFVKSRSSSVNGKTIVQTDDGLGEIYFGGTDGTNAIPAARIVAEVDGTPGADDMPGRLVFSTTADGASSPTERMRISSDGRVELTSILSNSSNVTALNNETTFQSGNSLARGMVSVVNSASNGGTPYTISNMYHFYTFDDTHNADVTVTNKHGYYAHPSLVESATNTYGFYGDIANASNRWNFYAGGTAPNYFTGEIASLGSYNDTTASAANVFIASNGDIQRSTSSIRYKTDIETLEQSYADNVILNARPVWYRSLCEADNAGWSYYGLIAEEVAELDPRLVFWGRPTKEILQEEAKDAVVDDEGNVIEPATEAVYTNVEDTDAELRPEGVQYERLTVMLIDVVQRQQKAIETLEAKVAALEAQ